MNVILSPVPLEGLPVYDKDHDQRSYTYGDEGEGILRSDRPLRVHVPTFRLDVSGQEKQDVLDLVRDTFLLRINTLAETFEREEGHELETMLIVLHGQPRFRFRHPDPHSDREGEWLFTSRVGFLAMGPGREGIPLEDFSVDLFLERNAT